MDLPKSVSNVEGHPDARLGLETKLQISPSRTPIHNVPSNPQERVCQMWTSPQQTPPLQELLQTRLHTRHGVILCCLPLLSPSLKKKRDKTCFASISAMEEKMSKPLRTRLFIRFQSAAKELCERKKKATTLENKPQDLSPDRQSAPGSQASVLILPLARSGERFGTGNCLTRAQLSHRCCVQMGNISVEIAYSHVL